MLKDIIAVAIFEKKRIGPPREDDSQQLRYKEPVMLAGAGTLAGLLATKKIKDWDQARRAAGKVGSAIKKSVEEK